MAEAPPARLTAGVHPLLCDPSLGFHAVARHQGPVVVRLMVTNAWSDWRNGRFWWIRSVDVAPAWCFRSGK